MPAERRWFQVNCTAAGASRTACPPGSVGPRRRPDRQRQRHKHRFQFNHLHSSLFSICSSFSLLRFPILFSSLSLFSVPLSTVSTYPRSLTLSSLFPPPPPPPPACCVVILRSLARSCPVPSTYPTPPTPFPSSPTTVPTSSSVLQLRNPPSLVEYY